MRDHRCLRAALLPLKESSKEAVADAFAGSLGGAKAYLHIDREMICELESIMLDASHHPRKQLVLVCGNVGDGKSHVLSYLSGLHPELATRFQIHNDATESTGPRRTSQEELLRLLAPFSDDRLDVGEERILLAINLGTLSNFLASDAEARLFGRLSDYVANQGLLEAGVAHRPGFDPESCFQQISFCDYPLFSLHDGGTLSRVIETAIERVTASTEANPFRAAYLSHREHHPHACPMRVNFDYLGREEIRRAISDLLVRCIVEGHLILSIRALYNFIYDLIVPPEIATRDCATGVDWLDRQAPSTRLRMLLPNALFEHPELSQIFTELAKLDPVCRRDEETDSDILRLVASRSRRRVVEGLLPGRRLPEEHSLLIDELADAPANTDLLVATVCRLRELSQDTDSAKRKAIYSDYLNLIHTWYSGAIDLRPVKSLYNLVTSALSSWWGKAPAGEVSTQVGRLQLQYRISQAVDIKPSPTPPPSPPAASRGDGLGQFDTRMRIAFGVDGNDVVLDVDYRLYELLRRIDQGYRPTAADHAEYAVFDRFVRDVAQKGATDGVTVTDSRDGRRFRLGKDAFGDYTFCELT